MNEILQNASEWKDFLWIVFTLAATLVAILTYMKTRNVFRQELYNRIIEKQLEDTSELLELLGNSWADFIIRCDINNMIKLNLIGHLGSMGCFSEADERLYEIFQEFYKSPEEMQLEKINLKDIESIRILKGDDWEYEEPCKEERVDDNTILSGQCFTLLDPRGLYIYTLDMRHVEEMMLKQLGNVYLPKNIHKELEKLHDLISNLYTEKFEALLRREEQRVIDADVGDEVEIEFAKLNNELIEDIKKGHILYKKLKREIRKFLNIDK